MKFNIPNSLTLVRILLIPIIVCLFLLSPQGYRTIIFSLFLLETITDYLDGFFARYMKQVTNFGTFLDPVADKLIVSAALLVLLQVHATAVFAFPALVIVSREIVVSALREWMAELGQRTSVAVSYLGKIKTVLQMVAITVLLAVDPEKYPEWDVVGIVLLYVAALLTLWTMIIYLRAAWPELFSKPGSRD